MVRLVRISCVLSTVAVALLATLFGLGAGKEPRPAFALLSVTALVMSAVAGLVGIAACLAADRRGRHWVAITVAGMAAVAGFPVFAIAAWLLLRGLGYELRD